MKETAAVFGQAHERKRRALARRQGAVLDTLPDMKRALPKERGQHAPLFPPYSVLTATLNVLPLTVRSSNVAALWRLPVSALLMTGSVIVAIAPICARSPNGPGAKRL